MDTVLKLRELRRMSGLTQADLARRSGIGLKTISSFETGERIDSMKLSQLRRLLSVYGLTEADFFSRSLDQMLEPMIQIEGSPAQEISNELRMLPAGLQQSLMEKFRMMVETANHLRILDRTAAPYTGAVSDWQMLSSRN